LKNFGQPPFEKKNNPRPENFQPAPPPLPGSCVPIKKLFRKNFQPDFPEKILKKILPEKFSVKKIKNFTRSNKNKKPPFSVLKPPPRNPLKTHFTTPPIRARDGPRFSKIPKQSPD
jgi:hypothetical protein